MKRILIATILVTCLPAVVGCQTTRYDAEVRRAAEDVGHRSGWTPQWSAPWADSVPQWDGKAELTARQAVTIALENNRQIRADIETIGLARADFVQAGLLPNPVLSMVYRAPSGDVHSVLGASVAQTLSDLWKRPARIDAAKADLQAAVLRVSASALDLVAEVQQTHARIVHDQRALELLNQNADTLERAHRLAKSKFDNGAGTQLDVARVEAEQLANATDIEAMRTELANEKLTLLESLGLAGASTDWRAVEQTPAALDLDAIGGEQAVIDVAKSQRLEVLAAHWEIKAQASRLHEQKLSVIPDIELGIDYEHADPSAFTVGPSLGFAIPLFDQNQAQIASAQVSVRQAVAAAAVAEQMTVREIRQAYRTYRSIATQIQLYRDKALPMQTRNLELAATAFQTGDSDLTVLLDVQDSANAAQLKLAELERDFAIARADLEHAAGGSVTLTRQAMPAPDDRAPNTPAPVAPTTRYTPR
ncbi:MAG: hypothetical protein GC159_18540 [Phycisphaera sp.]|nr:hypothetical protein [Phycisphaera sp.]